MKPLPVALLVCSLSLFAALAQIGQAGTAAYPPPSTEATKGVFVLRCELSHQRQVDPIVKPGPKGTLAGHLHDFFGNRSTDSDSTYESMTAAATTCGLLGDTGGYWSPSLIAPNGAVVQAKTMFAYYRNNPVRYGTTTPFPRDFRLIAGGLGTFPNSGWSCEKDASNMVQSPPYCGTTGMLVLHVRFPSCWDGVNTDSADHRSHVVYHQSGKCPASHPVKVPEVFLHVRFPRGMSGSGYKLSDGTLAPHADFWNTWRQDALEGLVRRCLNVGINCGTQTG